MFNLILNLAFGIFIPIYILNSDKLPVSPEVRLGIAVAFPLFYGAFEWWQTRKHNFIALLGLLNVLITGGFGLLNLDGLWFSMKEATFPFLIGIFVLISGYQSSPAFGKMLLNPEIFDTPKLDTTIDHHGKRSDFEALIKRCNLFLATSFFISALLNFLIAQKTFLPLEATLDAVTKANRLNEQIALMHKRGFLGIAIPSMIMMLGLLAYFLKRVEQLTGEKIDSFILVSATPSPENLGGTTESLDHESGRRPLKKENDSGSTY